MKALVVFLSFVLLALLIFGVWAAIVGSNNVAYPEGSRFETVSGKTLYDAGRGAFFEIIVKDKISEAMYIETAGGLVPLFNQDGTVMMYEDWLKEGEE